MTHADANAPAVGAATATPVAADGAANLSLKRKRRGGARKPKKKSAGSGSSGPGAPRRTGSAADDLNGGVDPSRFGKDLAHTDKEVRDKAFKNLSNWLRNKDLAELDWLKLWKGLFYCFWMSDKPLVQQRLAADLAAVSCGLKRENAWNYTEYFWRTLCREWLGIDRLRLDKYYMLMRKFLKQSFVSLSASNWDDGDVTRFVEIMSSFPLSPDSAEVPDSIRYQVADIFVEELENAIPGESLSSVPLKDILEPFINLLAGTDNKTVVERIQGNVFKVIVDRAVSTAKEGLAVPYDACELAAAVNLRAADASTPELNRKRMGKIAKLLESAFPAMEDVERREKVPPNGTLKSDEPERQ